MTQKLKSLVLIAGVLLFGLSPVLVAAPAAAEDISGNLCNGVQLQTTPTNGTGTTTCDGTGSLNLQNLLDTIINYFSIFVGVIAVIMIIVGGLRYITSGGDSGKVSAAKTTIIYALVGLVVVALAQLIVRFVLNQANGIITGA